MFLGLVQIETELDVALLVKNSSRVPVNADAAPAYRVYGPNGVMTSATGTLGFKQTGTVTNATNVSPIVITSVGHGLQTGMKVTVANVGGNTNANGTWTITRTGADTFSLNGSTGNSAYTSGGTWNVSGLYDFSFTPQGMNGFASGQTYSVYVSYAISSTTYADLYTFTVC